ncbi:MAG: hypothetical protein HYX89_07335 [Chloroflexi bacterium]|nr:hypothetical protein [Chloroflexota bacterium]
MVESEAQKLERQGYDVEADVRGYPKPVTIRGYRPDVVGHKGHERKIIEVETPDSVDSARDEAQQAAFRRAADQSTNTTFTRKVTG